MDACYIIDGCAGRLRLGTGLPSAARYSCGLGYVWNGIVVVDLVANSRSFRRRPLSTYGVKKLECSYLADCCPDFSNLCCWSKLRRLIPRDQEKAMATKFDLASIRSSFGPRRSPTLRTFADFGMTPRKATEDALVFEKPGKWLYELKIAARRDSNGDGIRFGGLLHRSSLEWRNVQHIEQFAGYTVLRRLCSLPRSRYPALLKLVECCRFSLKI